MSRKIILIKQEVLLIVYELNRSGLLAENEKIRPILAFFFNDTATTEIYTLSLHDALPISTATKEIQYLNAKGALTYTDIAGDPVLYGNLSVKRSEERFSRNAETDLVCRLLLEKKKEDLIHGFTNWETHLR